VYRRNSITNSQYILTHFLNSMQVNAPYMKLSPETLFSMLKCSLSNEDYRMLSQQAHSCLQQFLLSSGHLIKHQLLKESIICKR